MNPPIDISEEAGVRYLHFGSDWIQGAMRIRSPRKLELANQRELAADQHDQFIDLIEAGNADAAADLAVAHWELSRAQIESFVTPVSLQFPLGNAPGSEPKRGAS